MTIAVDLGLKATKQANKVTSRIEKKCMNTKGVKLVEADIIQ